MAGTEEMFSRLKQDWEHILQSFEQEANFEPEQIIVVGCSTSEVLGRRIGKGSSLEIAETMMNPLMAWAQRLNVYLAIQCCEHLNRVLIVEKECAQRYDLEPVIVQPSLNAGGALSLQAWQQFSSPLAVEHVKAHGGIDIGDTFIGMHLRPVVVPVRIDTKTLGSAHITLAKTRPKYIGGPRAAYPCI